MRIAAYVSVALFAFALEACGQFTTYSVWRHVEAIGATGKKLESDEFRGRRANGDTVETFTGLRRRLHSQAHGIEVDIDDTLKITTTYGTGQGEPPLNRWDCREGEDHDRPPRPEDIKAILGFQVIRFVSANPIMHEEKWRAPDLNCEDLERTVYFFENGKPDGYTLYTTTKAVAAAPDESLFAIPDGALEMPTSRYLSFIGKFPSRAHDQKVQMMGDELYAKHQLKRQAAGVTLDVFKREAR
jgi:hypothetical protein